jgi:hypothetical protein
MGKRSQGWGVFGEMIARGPAFFWLSLRARKWDLGACCCALRNWEPHVSWREFWKASCGCEWPARCFDYGGAFANRMGLRR